MRVAALLFLPVLAFSHSSTTTGQCSPIAPNNSGSVTINCSGLTASQRQLLAKRPSPPDEVAGFPIGQYSRDPAKLDVCIEQGAARHVAKEQIDSLDRALRPYAGQKIQIQIYTMVKESNDFGGEVSAALKHAGLDPEDMRRNEHVWTSYGILFDPWKQRRQIARGCRQSAS